MGRSDGPYFLDMDMTRRYPSLGSISAAQKAMCSCCERKAINRIDIQEDHMRGNDEVMQVCDVHLDMAREENWRTLYRDFNVERERRRNQHQK